MIDDPNSAHLIHRLIDTGVAPRADGADHLSPSRLAGASDSREALSLAQLTFAIGEGRDVRENVVELDRRGQKGSGTRSAALPLFEIAVRRLNEGVLQDNKGSLRDGRPTKPDVPLEDVMLANAVVGTWRSRAEVAPV